jgi:hypothetical protein
MVIFDNDRLSHWFAGSVLTWAAIFLFWGVLVFHCWLKVSIATIAMFVGLGCAVQLVITPWLYSARATRQNPEGRRCRRAAAMIVWMSATALLLFCYMPLTLVGDKDSRQFSTIAFIMIVGLAFTALVIVGLISRRRKDPTTIYERR